MILSTFGAGWYCDALPDGRYVVLRLDGSMTTDAGDVPPPPFGRAALFPRLNALAPRTQFAGQAWEAYATLICTDGVWTDGPNPCGVSPVIYDNAGVLHISDCSIGSQGYRYCSAANVLVTGDQTYGPSLMAPRLYEWTDLGPFVIGQGDQGGVWLWDVAAQVHRVLVAGPASCRFIRAHLSGDRVSVAFYTEGPAQFASIYFGTVADFLSLPVLTPAPIPPEPLPPTPIPPTPIPPTPTPVPVMTDTLTSSNGTYRLVMQNDGNLVLYGPNGPLWASNTNQDATGTPPVPPGPTPPNPPVYQDGRVGGSFYTALTCPWVDPKGYAQALANCGVGLTRLWLLDAWAVNGGEDAGQYPGFLPVKRTSDGRFDLRQWDPAYFDRLQVFAGALRDAKILPQFTLLELYTWAQRKQGMLWVPDANKGPYRSNVNGVRWGDPDDPTFYALPDDWLDEFIGHALEALGGFPFTIELANEMPEKDLHYRLRDCVRDHGYPGPVQVNRNEDTPGQYWNMKIGTEFQSLALHGMKTLDYLDVEYPEEAAAGRPTTFRDMWPMVDASRVTLSSDGCRKSTDVTDAYDYPALTEVAKDTLARGGSYEHQLACKLRIFTEGVFRLEDIEQFDGPFLRGLR